LGQKASSRKPGPASERASVQKLRTRRHAQVLIIGGGINGVGTFRDLALQGVDVALVERGDYCQGASGASSHMIHGGIRYLENGEFRLVQESVVERNRLLRIAPHYVKPLQTTIPIFSTFSGVLAAPLRFLTHKQQGRPKERGAFLIKLGLSMYDFFSRDGGTVPRHEFRGRQRALAELPRLHPDIKYTATYFDASVHNPERLTLDVLQDGEKAGAGGRNARASNYVSLVSMTGAAGVGSTGADRKHRDRKHRPAPRRAHRRGLRLHGRRHRQHHRRLGRHDQPGHGCGLLVHGWDQGLAHRAGPCGTAGGLQRA
jgi:glycerol-3-phosphate dehydrogenase